MSKYISIKDAEIMNAEGIKNIILLEGSDPKSEYYAECMTNHTKLVADAAMKIAKRIPDLDPEKAYVYGTLHDYGKYFGDVLGKQYFHGLYGYNKLNEMGYHDIAKINLTHTFLEKDFNLDEYASYQTEDLLKVKEIFKTIEFDDYDKLIQICDLLPKKAGGYNRFEKRFERIEKVYNLSPEVTQKRIFNATVLKKYFDEKCHFDIYQLLGVEDE